MGFLDIIDPFGIGQASVAKVGSWLPDPDPEPPPTPLWKKLAWGAGIIVAILIAVRLWRRSKGKSRA